MNSPVIFPQFLPHLLLMADRRTLQVADRPPRPVARRPPSTLASVFALVRTPLIPTFVWYRSRVKRWPESPDLNPPASSLAASNGGPPRGHLLRPGAPPNRPRSNPHRPIQIQRISSSRTPSGGKTIKESLSFMVIYIQVPVQCFNQIYDLFLFRK